MNEPISTNQGGLLATTLDLAGLGACKSRLATTVRLMDAMRFDAMHSVVQSIPMPMRVNREFDKARMIGTSRLLDGRVGKMDAGVEMTILPQDGWLAMHIQVKCAPMLSSTIFRETVRSDMSNLWSPADGKEAALSSMKRLLRMVVRAEAHMRRCVEQGANPDECGTLVEAVRKHEELASSILSIASEGHDEEEHEKSFPDHLYFDFGNPYPTTAQRGAASSGCDEPCPISHEGMAWLASKAPSITQLNETREGVGVVYSFGSYEGSCTTGTEMSTMDKLRLFSISGGAPDNLLNQAWLDA